MMKNRVLVRLFGLIYLIFSILLFCQIMSGSFNDLYRSYFGGIGNGNAYSDSRYKDVNTEGTTAKPTGDANSEDPLSEREKRAKIAIVMFGCNRTQYMVRSLEQLISIRNKTLTRFRDRYQVSELFIDKNVQLPIILSMDCHYKPTLNAMKSFLTRNDSISKLYDFVEIDEYMKGKRAVVLKHFRPYYRLSRNYYLGFTNIFQDYPNVEQLIVVEDDLAYSEDFLEYFISLSPILKDNKDIFCIAAWNDNGKDSLLNHTMDARILRHTDFFPGLGWMFTRELWNTELSKNWPDAFWDDWIRGKMNGRTCIQPTVSRSSTFGVLGASNGQFYSKHLTHIHPSMEYVPFYPDVGTFVDSLRTPHFDQILLDAVYTQGQQIDAAKFDHFSRIGTLDNGTMYTIIYYTNYQFKQYCARFELMTDLKWGIPRSAYKGIITFRKNGYKTFLAPPPTRTAYIKDWN